MNQSMMMSNAEEFENGISKIRDASNNIKRIFANENNNIETINNTEIWYGITDQAFYEKYKEFRNNYAGIENSLDNIVKFLEGVLNSYKATNESINNNINSLADTFNING